MSHEATASSIGVDEWADKATKIDRAAASSAHDDAAIEAEGTAIENEGTAIESEGTAIENEGTAIENEGTAIDDEAAL